MRVVFEIGGLPRAILFSLLPVVAGAGAMGLPLLLSLAGLAAIRPSQLRQVLETRPVVLILLAAFAAWAAISGAWSDWREPTAAKVLALLILGLIFAASAASDARAARLTLAGGLAAFLVLALILGIEASFGLPLNRAAEPDWEFVEVNRNPGRGLVVLLALAWPAVAWLIAGGGWARALTALIVTVGAGVLSLQFGQSSAAFGFAAGLVAFGAANAAPVLATRAVSLGLAAWLLLAPFLTPMLVSSPRLVESMPFSWAARVAIWRYTCAQILDRPWIGHGIDAGRATTEMTSVQGIEMRAMGVSRHQA